MKTSSFTKLSLSFQKLALLLFSIVLVSANAAADKAGRGSFSEADKSSVDEVSTLDADVDVVSTLDADEASHLTFMREEEKLARDVYLKFAEMYPEQGAFSAIAKQSEQTHADTMRDKLNQFNLPDPNPDTNKLPESLGVFTGEEWGWYFDEKYGELVEMGSESELAALYVGALIEELDMHDIVDCPQVMVDAGYSDPCGLMHTDESALINAYNFLIDGSENHLRAYVGQIEAVIGAGNYEPQYLTQEEVDAILGR